MKVLRIAAALPVVALSFASVMAVQPAHATSSSDCKVEANIRPGWAGAIDETAKNGTVTGLFKVTKGTCDVSLATWKTPSANGQPYDKQTLFDHATVTFGVGQHTLTVKLPDCNRQTDLVRGSNPTGKNGTAVYEEGRVMDSLREGIKKCEETPKPPVTPPETPPETPTTPETPSTPETPQTPETPSTPEAPKKETPAPQQKTAAKLPETGAGTIVAVVTIAAALAAAGLQYFRQYRASRANR